MAAKLILPYFFLCCLVTIAAAQQKNPAIQRVTSPGNTVFFKQQTGLSFIGLVINNRNNFAAAVVSGGAVAACTRQ